MALVLHACRGKEGPNPAKSGLSGLVWRRSIPDIRALMSHRGMPATPSYVMLRLVRRKKLTEIFLAMRRLTASSHRYQSQPCKQTNALPLPASGCNKKANRITISPFFARRQAAVSTHHQPGEYLTQSTIHTGGRIQFAVRHRPSSASHPATAEANE
jgi:hypothetical protein